MLVAETTDHRLAVHTVQSLTLGEPQSLAVEPSITELLRDRPGQPGSRPHAVVNTSVCAHPEGWIQESNQPHEQMSFDDLPGPKHSFKRWRPSLPLLPTQSVK